MLASHKRAVELSDSLWSLKEVLLVGFFLQIGLLGHPDLTMVQHALLLNLLVLFICVPLAELYLLFKLAEHTSIGATLLIATRLPSEYAPKEDRGAFFVLVNGPDGASYAYMKEYMDEIRAKLGDLSGVQVFPVMRQGFGARIQKPVQFVIMLTVPLAMAGALFGLWITGRSLNIYSEIGLIMLVGLAAKNGILIVELAIQNRRGERKWRK
jgi:multidrug efflux pump subunit AcrB